MAYPDNEALKQMFKDSQGDHQINLEGDDKMAKKDQERIKKLFELQKSGQVRSANDFLIASLIYQYGKTIQDLDESFKSAQKSVELGIPPHESLLPQATDNLMVAQQVRVGIHKSLAKQKFGTKIALWMDEGRTVSFCPLDGTVTEQELSLYGLPDCRKFEGKPYQDYTNALTQAKQKAAQAWQANHK